eukprot:965212_1
MEYTAIRAVNPGHQRNTMSIWLRIVAGFRLLRAACSSTVGSGAMSRNITSGWNAHDAIVATSRGFHHSETPPSSRPAETVLQTPDAAINEKLNPANIRSDMRRPSM